MHHVGESNEGHSSSTMIGPSNHCKGVSNEASLTPWCQAVIRFEMKMSRSPTRVRRTLRTQLGPSHKS